MRPARASFQRVYIRFLTRGKAIAINLSDTIYNEQFGSLSFFLHFLSVQQYATVPSLSFPADGWITLDKELDSSDVIEHTFDFGFSSFQDFLKFVKRRVSYDIRCLKRFESDLARNKGTVTFIEDIARSWPDLFKRTQLRQLKRIYNQRIALAEFKTKTEPSRFHSLNNIWEYLVSVGSRWSLRTTDVPFSEQTIEELWSHLQQD